MSPGREGLLAKIRAVLEERLVLMAPARRLRLALVDGVLAGVARKRPIRVLDAGCGDGLLSLAIAERHPDWTVLGVDIRDDMLDGARSESTGAVAGERQLSTGRPDRADARDGIRRGPRDRVSQRDTG